MVMPVSMGTMPVPVRKIVLGRVMMGDVEVSVPVLVLLLLAVVVPVDVLVAASFPASRRISLSAASGSTLRRRFVSAT